MCLWKIDIRTVFDLWINECRFSRQIIFTFNAFDHELSFLFAQFSKFSVEHFCDELRKMKYWRRFYLNQYISQSNDLIYKSSILSKASYQSFLSDHQVEQDEVFSDICQQSRYFNLFDDFIDRRLFEYCQAWFIQLHCFETSDLTFSSWNLSIWQKLHDLRFWKRNKSQ